MANMQSIKNTITTTTTTTNNTGQISIYPLIAPQQHVYGPASNPNHWGGGSMLNNNNWPVMPSAQSLGLSPSLLIALISFDEVLPETRFFLMKYINLIETSISFTITAKSGNPLIIDPEISKFFLEGTGSVPNLNEIAINDLVSKGYVERKIEKDSVFFTQSGIDLLQGFIQFDKL